MRYGSSGNLTATQPDKTGIEAADLCTILANLLDNAIEATGKLPEQTTPLKIRIQSIKTDPRYLHQSSRSLQRFLLSQMR